MASIFLNYKNDIGYSEILKKWKELCYKKFGHGGLKKRFIELINDDLNLMGVEDGCQ